MATEEIGEYRGCTLLKYLLDPPRYGSPCTIYLRKNVDKVKADIDEELGPADPPPPPTDEDSLVETYRGVDIWWKVDLELYWAQVATGYVAVASTLAEMYVSIDEILEFLEPPEDPADGLFGQIIAAVKVWVKKVMPDFLQPVYDWVDSLFAAGRDAWESLIADINTVIVDVNASLTSLATDVRDRWDTFTTETLPTIFSTITHKVGEVRDALIQAQLDLISYMIKGLADMTSYVDGRILVWDPIGFLKDPAGYITGVWNMLISPWVEGVMKSFGEGFEEGLEE